MSFREKRQGEKCYRGETSLGRNDLIPFGGYNGEKEENTIEVFDQETLKWELVKDFQMKKCKSGFG